MHRCDAALPVDDKSGGQRFHSAVFIRQRLVANHNRIRNLVLRKMRPDHLPTLVIHRHAQGRKPARFVLILEFVEPRNFNLARPAPSGPEIEQHHFTLVVAELLGFAGGIGKREIYRGFWVRRLSGSLRLPQALLLSQEKKRAAQHRRAEHFAPGQAVVQFHQCIPFSGSRPYGRR